MLLDRATLQSPAVVCDHLYAPALARAFKGDTGHSCSWYYTSAKSNSFRIRRVREGGPPRPSKPKSWAPDASGAYFTMLLSRVRGGWQAFDVVSGRSVRAR